MSGKPDPLREPNILQHLKDGRTRREVADLEGIGIGYAGTEMMRIAHKHGLTKVVDGKRTIIKPAVRADPINYFSEENRSFRLNLATLLDLYSKDPHKIKRTVGLQPIEQQRAKGFKKSTYNHDWTMVQMSRLAKALGITFTELVGIANGGTFAVSSWLERKKKA